MSSTSPPSGHNADSHLTQGLRAVTIDPLPAIIHATMTAADGMVNKQSIRLGQQSVVVGAGTDVDLLVFDQAVSRRHLQARLVAGGVLLTDLQSRNGSFYLGQRFNEMTLSLGSSVTIGQTELRFLADREDFEGTQSTGKQSYGSLHGSAPCMQRLFALMQRLEGSLVNVLIDGESRTEKELIARAIHQNSLHKDGPFIAINCGALDRSLVRSELFGHKRGAFTGALSESSGAFADADGGTLFLDEVGELPLEIQPILLRVLETGAYARVGETRARPVSVRVIAATHRNLKADVSDGLFRADLYYRLMVVQLNAPPLRERIEDIPLLARMIARAEGLAEPPAEVIEQLTRRSFPGNVRELKHALLAYSALGELPYAHNDPGKQSKSDDSLAQFANPELPYAEQKEALVDRMTYLYLKALIERCKGNRSEAARVAQLQRGYLRRLLQKYGLDSDLGDD